MILAHWHRPVLWWKSKCVCLTKNSRSLWLTSPTVMWVLRQCLASRQSWDSFLGLVTWCLGLFSVLGLLYPLTLFEMLCKVVQPSFTFLSFVTVNIHIIISGTGTTCAGFCLRCYASFPEMSCCWSRSPVDAWVSIFLMVQEAHLGHYMSVIGLVC